MVKNKRIIQRSEEEKEARVAAFRQLSDASQKSEEDSAHQIAAGLSCLSQMSDMPKLKVRLEELCIEMPEANNGKSVTPLIQTYPQLEIEYDSSSCSSKIDLEVRDKQVSSPSKIGRIKEPEAEDEDESESDSGTDDEYSEL